MLLTRHAAKICFLALVFALWFVAVADADTRDVSDRTGRTIDVGRETINNNSDNEDTNSDDLDGSFGNIGWPSSSSDGIQSNTETGADSGGNSGGTVITGDETEEVFVVNVGPINTTNDTAVEDEPEVNGDGGDGGETPQNQECDRRSSECTAGDINDRTTR